MRETVFMVDDDITNLLVGKNALIGKYNFFTISSGAKLFKMLKIVRPKLILLDIEMPDLNGIEIIKILKSDPETRDIPVIFLTAKSDSESEIFGLSVGAIDYIIKPFSVPLLLKRIEAHLLIFNQRDKLKDYNENLELMVTEKTKKVTTLQSSVISIFSEIVEFRDDITGKHIERTQGFLTILVNEILEKGLFEQETRQWDLQYLLPSSQLHDIGKIAISDLILKKPGKLTPEEFETMKTHALKGVAILEQMGAKIPDSEFLKHAKLFAGGHHEKWNGKGYPYGLAGDSIPLESRLMAIVDVYDALRSKRPYKEPFTHEESLEMIVAESGEHFDPRLVDLLISLSSEFEAYHNATLN